jgi:hypothetical protein
MNWKEGPDVSLLPALYAYILCILTSPVTVFSNPTVPPFALGLAIGGQCSHPGGIANSNILTMIQASETSNS